MKTRTVDLSRRGQRKSSALAAAIGGGKAANSGTARSFKALTQEAVVRNVFGRAAADWVARCVASLPVVWMDGEEPLSPTHPLSRLWRQVNPLQSGSDVVEMLVLHLQLAGTCDLLGRGVHEGKAPLELWPVRPDTVTVLQQRGTPMPRGYKVDDADAGLKDVFPIDPVTGRSDLLHLRLPHPLSPVAGKGLSRVEPASGAVDISNAGSAWNYSLLQRGARPMGGFSTPEMLEDDSYQHLRREVDEMISGADNAGRPLLLEGGLQWMNLGQSPVDMDWIRGYEAAAREIATAFGVPAQVLGIPGSQTFANYREARMAGYEDTVVPMGDRFLDALNRWLAPRYGDGVWGYIDRDEVEALSPKREARWDRIGKATSLTDNEKRAELGYGPVEGGDSLYATPDRVPLEFLADGVGLQAAALRAPEEGEGEGEKARVKGQAFSDMDPVTAVLRNVLGALHRGDLTSEDAAAQVAEALGIEQYEAEVMVAEVWDTEDPGKRLDAALAALKRAAGG